MPQPVQRPNKYTFIHPHTNNHQHHHNENYLAGVVRSIMSDATEFLTRYGSIDGSVLQYCELH